VVVLQFQDGSEKQVTQGPLDGTPIFSPDGTSWLHSKADSGEILECTVASRRCSPIHVDTLIPAFPSIDPSGQLIAYITMMNAPRVWIVPRSGGVSRDLGPAGEACAPIWASASRLWVAQAPAGREMTWAEIDTKTGRRTGELQRVILPKELDCAVPKHLLTIGRTPYVTSALSETSQLFRAADLAGIALSPRRVQHPLPMK